MMHSFLMGRSNRSNIRAKPVSFSVLRWGRVVDEVHYAGARRAQKASSLPAYHRKNRITNAR